MRHDTNATQPPIVQPPSYAEQWLRRRYGLTEAAAAVIAGLAFPIATALANGTSTSAERVR